MDWHDKTREDLASSVRQMKCSSYEEMKDCVKKDLKARGIPFVEQRDPTPDMQSFITPSCSGKRLVVTLKSDETAGMCDEGKLDPKAMCFYDGKSVPFKDVVKQY